MESPKVHIGQRWPKLVLYAMYTTLSTHEWCDAHSVASTCVHRETRRHKTYHIFYSGCYPKSSLSCCLECWDVCMWINYLLRGIFTRRVVVFWHLYLGRWCTDNGGQWWGKLDSRDENLLFKHFPAILAGPVAPRKKPGCRPFFLLKNKNPDSIQILLGLLRV